MARLIRVEVMLFYMSNSSSQIKGKKPQVKSSSFTLHMTDEMKENLNKTSRTTGLGMAEIVRRGIHSQLNQLKKVSE